MAKRRFGFYADTVLPLPIGGPEPLGEERTQSISPLASFVEGDTPEAYARRVGALPAAAAPAATDRDDKPRFDSVEGFLDEGQDSGFVGPPAPAAASRGVAASAGAPSGGGGGADRFENIFQAVLSQERLRAEEARVEAGGAYARLKQMVDVRNDTGRLTRERARKNRAFRLGARNLRSERFQNWAVSRMDQGERDLMELQERGIGQDGDVAGGSEQYRALQDYAREAESGVEVRALSAVEQLLAQAEAAAAESAEETRQFEATLGERGRQFDTRESRESEEFEAGQAADREKLNEQRRLIAIQQAESSVEDLEAMVEEDDSVEPKLAQARHALEILRAKAVGQPFRDADGNLWHITPEGTFEEFEEEE